MKETYLYEKLKEKKIPCQNYPSLKKIFRELYVDKKLPMERIAEMLGVAPSLIFHWLHHFNIPIRRLKYKKYDFSGDPKERAYILGLVAGDIYAHKHGRQIAAELTTTHPAMMDLFYSVFGKYGRPTKHIKYNKKTGRYEWAGYVLLNNSFEFMLSKNFDIDNEYFYQFLAGFFDSEGCFHIYNNHSWIGLVALLYNSNKKLLRTIKKRLEKDGFHPKFSKYFERGESISDGYFRKKDLWAIGMYTNEEVLTLMNNMPIKHKEKLDRLQIVSSINSNKWEEISEQIDKLRAGIKREVKEYIKPHNIASK